MNGRDESQAASSSGDELAQAQGLFIVHKLSRLDTLAGLAVRYHVTVSDIKRSNSLLSDSAMFARDSLLIPTRPLPMGLEYSAWAGMIVTQYGQISRTSGDHTSGSFTGSSCGGPHNPQRASAIDQLRAHYGLTPSGSPTNGRESSDDGYASMRPGEVEMQDLSPTRGGGSSHPLAAGPWLPELVSYAGARSGPSSGDERLRRRQTGDDSDYWDAAEPSGGSSGGGALSGSGLYPGGSASLPENPASPPGSSSSDRSRRPPPAPSLPPDPAHLRTGSASGLPLPRRSSGSASSAVAGAGSSRRQRESLFDKVKRAASQPQLAISAASSAAAAAAARVADSSPSAGLRRSAAHSRSRSLLQDAAAALQQPKEVSKKE